MTFSGTPGELAEDEVIQRAYLGAEGGVEAGVSARPRYAARSLR